MSDSTRNLISVNSIRIRLSHEILNVDVDVRLRWNGRYPHQREEIQLSEMYNSFGIHYCAYDSVMCSDSGIDTEVGKI